MKDRIPDAGKLDERLSVLELKETSAGVWEWKETRKTWGNVEKKTAQRNLFSNVGIGARHADVVLRKQELTLFHALRQGSQHMFLTSILSHGRGHLDVAVALVTIRSCRADADLAAPGPSFPGVLTEKYAGHDQPDLHSEVTRDYVLVAPKQITLKPGSWVTVNGAYYLVRVPHELDEFKNEYEIRKREDC